MRVETKARISVETYEAARLAKETARQKQSEAESAIAAAQNADGVINAYRQQNNEDFKEAIYALMTEWEWRDGTHELRAKVLASLGCVRHCARKRI